MRHALALLVIAIGCGPSASTPAPSPEQVVPQPPIVPEPPPLEEPAEEVPPPSYDDADLDAMDRSELESACFAGSSAACDRLGH